MRRNVAWPRGEWSRRRLAPALMLATAALAGAAGDIRGDARESQASPPALLSQTGLYSDPSARLVASGLVAFSPQYPLWTDGATKRRWIALPPGTSVDASYPDDWQFPTGTRIWKEFSFDRRPVETRYMQRLSDGSWLYAAYAWREDGVDADLVRAQGRRRAHPLGDGRFHAIPGIADCKACHEGLPSRVLGFSALQLSGDRDPMAPHGEQTGEGLADLARLTATGFLTGLPDVLARRPPRMPGDPVTRAATGYLHGNCGHCHNESGLLANLSLSFWQSVAETSDDAGSAIRSAADVPARRIGVESWQRIEPGRPERSLVYSRAASREPAWQMPPLGTALPDTQALALLRDWISRLRAPDHRRTSP